MGIFQLKTSLNLDTPQNKTRNILVIRFSAMGDVVLLAPILRNLLEKHPHIHITLLTRPFFHPFFEQISNLTLYSVALKEKHKGIRGLYRLAQELKKNRKWDAVFDLHKVLRSRILCLFLGVTIPCFRLDKGRNAKKRVIKSKEIKQLPHTIERYREVFRQAGLDFPLEKKLLLLKKDKAFYPKKYLNTNKISIGIAPFAAHKSKQWGVENIHKLIMQINQKYAVHFYLIGGGKQETEQLDMMAQAYANVINLAGRFSLLEELALVKELDALVCMDSGNMHIASLLGISVISVWGGTHPCLGFSALYQKSENSIQPPENLLTCRPCSVYGTDSCRLENSFKCMQLITPDDIINRLEVLGILS